LQNNGGCSDICSMVNDQTICSCEEGKHLAPDFKTCIGNESNFIFETWVYYITMISLKQKTD